MRKPSSSHWPVLRLIVRPPAWPPSPRVTIALRKFFRMTVPLISRIASASPVVGLGTVLTATDRSSAANSTGPILKLPVTRTCSDVPGVSRIFHWPSCSFPAPRVGGRVPRGLPAPPLAVSVLGVAARQRQVARDVEIFKLAVRVQVAGDLDDPAGDADLAAEELGAVARLDAREVDPGV